METKLSASLGKRICVVGCPGAGKSTFSVQLGKILGIPVVHMDLLFWHEDGSHVTREELIRKLGPVMGEEAWIIDGNYNGTMELRLRFCDTVFFLDLPREVCIEGVKARVGVKRPDFPWIAKTLDPEFLEYVENFETTDMPAIRELLAGLRETSVTVFHGREEINEYLRRLEDEARGNSAADAGAAQCAGVSESAD